jgi:DNA modification methylase
VEAGGVNPFVSDPDFTMFVGDVRDVLAELADESVHCVVTSPPYWGLRDYGTGEWEGGDAECDHSPDINDRKDRDRRNEIRDDEAGIYAHPSSWIGGGRAASRVAGAVCKCGATRTDRQLGLEPTPEEYVANMVEVFREVRRVLRKDGTCWVNLGDSYQSNPGSGYASGDLGNLAGKNSAKYQETMKRGHATKNVPKVAGLKPKDLVGIPWRVAFALQADGWYLRADIIWAKPNPMPESVTDRPTKAHEYVFLLTKSPRYFFDQEAVREASIYPDDNRKARQNGSDYLERAVEDRVSTINPLNARTYPTRNIRSVWEIATQPYPEAHFATYPEALVERCLKAGTSERGCCPECGALWVRVVEPAKDYAALLASQRGSEAWSGKRRAEASKIGNAFGDKKEGATAEYRTTGWRLHCIHGDTWIGKDGRHISAPCVVLDPFLGSGTTALVARRLGRKCIGIELSPEYAALAARRLSQLSLLAEPA